MLFQRIHCRTFTHIKVDHLVTCEIDQAGVPLLFSWAGTTRLLWLFYITQLQFPAEAELHFRPCAHSDFSAGASNRDNPGADRLLLLWSPGQGEPGQNPFHASPEDVTFHSMNHATSNTIDVLETSLNTQRDDRALLQAHWADCQLLRHKAVNKRRCILPFSEHFLNVLPMLRSPWQVSCRWDTLIKNKK